jgi:hypothetical protein
MCTPSAGQLHHRYTPHSCAPNAYDMESLGDYVYEALKQPDKTIRLLKILSISPHICCKLIVVPLNSLPAYNTLSYVWGDFKAREHVEVEGKRLKITSSLVCALRDVHGQFEENSGDMSVKQWLWADGICINQSDDHEKNHQVPLMRNIYFKCTRMFSWLGCENGGVNGFSNGDIFDAVKLVSTAIAKSAVYDLFMSKFNHNNHLSSSALMEYNSKVAYQTGHEFPDLA